MSSARAREAARNAHKAAYDDAVSTYAALGQDELRAAALPGVEHPVGSTLGQKSAALADQRLGQLGPGVGDDLRAEQAGGELGAGETDGLEGLVDQVGAEDPVAALDHDVQRAVGVGHEEFLDRIAVQGGQVEVGASGWGDGCLVGAVVEAYGSDLRGLAVGEVDSGAFGVFLGPAAVGVRAGDAQVWCAGGGGEPPAGGVEAGQEAEPCAAEVLAGLLLAVGLDPVRDTQAPRERGEQGLVEGGDEVGQGLVTERLGVGALVSVAADRVGGQFVGGVAHRR
jgi:hypothetical protein